MAKDGSKITGALVNGELFGICIKCGSMNAVPTGYGFQMICRDCGQIWRV